MADKKVINLKDFYTRENEQNGMWFEPVVDEPLGIEFLVISVSSNEGVALMEHYDREQKEAQKEKDPQIRARKLEEIDAERTAALVKGVRAVDGYELQDENGNKVDFSLPLVKEFFFNAPLVKVSVIKFAIDTANFMNRKKSL